MSLPCIACGGTRVLTGDDRGPHGGETTSECDECRGTGVQPCAACVADGYRDDAVKVVDFSEDGGPRDYAMCAMHLAESTKRQRDRALREEI